ncbi:MAG: type I-MYXAN CRISPR-associated protein Cas6/Cmx6 [Bacteroidales bacterium]|nr:type I-MYXAN CRISPR-associated protein Cas6/Cmx6 [Bacteroidales bacterium]
MMIDLIFPVRGDSVPVDHAYPLYAALSTIVPKFHEASSPFRFALLTGQIAGGGVLNLNALSKLRVRLPENRVRELLPLAGKRLMIGKAGVRLGVPSLQTLQPVESLYSRLITFKNAETPEQFLTTARQKLAEAGIGGAPQLPVQLMGERAGEPQRKVVRVKGVTIVGYALIVSGLTPEDSLALQEQGLGGRTQIGCGFFLPAQEDAG